MNRTIHYLMYKNPGIWTPEKEDLLQKALSFFGSKLNYILLSICFTGWTMKQIYNHYLTNIQTGMYQVTALQQERIFDPNLKRYFLSKKEIGLIKEIIWAFKKSAM